MHLLPSNWPELTPEAIARIAPLHELEYSAFSRANIRVAIKREDLLHPALGGNKIYKLLGHLALWRQKFKALALASFGGAYSNHLLALAAAGAELGCPTWGIVRGERPAKLSPTLIDAKELGMTLHFVSRSDYRRRDCPNFSAELKAEIGDAFWIPEGGAGVPALSGCKALAREILSLGPVDYICHACGTGASLAGIASGLSEGARALGFSVLRGDISVMRKDVADLLRRVDAENGHWDILEARGGNYGKLSPDLHAFMEHFQEETKIPLDAVYTAKLMWAVVQRAEQGYWPRASRIVLVHSGGLQGNRGFPQLLGQGK